jgi:hypothetical protein
MLLAWSCLAAAAAAGGEVVCCVVAAAAVHHVPHGLRPSVTGAPAQPQRIVTAQLCPAKHIQHHVRCTAENVNIAVVQASFKTLDSCQMAPQTQG